MKKPVLVFLILLKIPLKALMLEAPTACWFSCFHLFVKVNVDLYSTLSWSHL